MGDGAGALGTGILLWHHHPRSEEQQARKPGRRQARARGPWLSACAKRAFRARASLRRAPPGEVQGLG